jgi:hypothetical protein
LSLCYPFVVTACTAEVDATDVTGASDEGTAVQMFRIQNAEKVANVAPEGARLTYRGGATLTSVRVRPVFWTADTQFQTHLDAFYKAVTGSSLFGMLSQYSRIQPGAARPGVVAQASTAEVTDARIRAILNRMFAANRLPSPDANSYYPVHFPAGVTVRAPDGSKSCVDFCAYHGTYVNNGVNVNYAVIPDQGGACATRCARTSARIPNLDVVSSHVLLGATTNPAGRPAARPARPMAWYDSKYGEISDICNGQVGTIVGGDGVRYPVQLAFSNAANNCVVK